MVFKAIPDMTCPAEEKAEAGWNGPKDQGVVGPGTGTGEKASVT